MVPIRHPNLQLLSGKPGGMIREVVVWCSVCQLVLQVSQCAVCDTWIHSCTTLSCDLPSREMVLDLALSFSFLLVKSFTCPEKCLGQQGTSSVACQSVRCYSSFDLSEPLLWPYSTHLQPEEVVALLELQLMETEGATENCFFCFSSSLLMNKLHTCTLQVLKVSLQVQEYNSL